MGPMPKARPAKTVQAGAALSPVVRHLLDPASDKANAKSVLEALDGRTFQIGNMPLS